MLGYYYSSVSGGMIAQLLTRYTTSITQCMQNVI